MENSSLKELEADGIIVRTQFDGIPVRVEYSLTDYGTEAGQMDRPERLSHSMKVIETARADILT